MSLPVPHAIYLHKEWDFRNRDKRIGSMLASCFLEKTSKFLQLYAVRLVFFVDVLEIYILAEITSDYLKIML